MSAACGRDKFTVCRIVGVAICFRANDVRSIAIFAAYLCVSIPIWLYPLCTLISLCTR